MLNRNAKYDLYPSSSLSKTFVSNARVAGKPGMNSSASGFKTWWCWSICPSVLKNLKDDR